jgi:DNA-binding NarL/FixJ family response regulator
MKVLIADSSRTVTERLADLMLDIPSVELLAPTASGEATLDSVRANNPQILVIDARILGGKGKEILQTIRREKPAIVLIIHSNLVDPQYRKHYEAAGADLFMDKSNEFIHLYQFVRELVHGPECEEGKPAGNGIRKRLARTKLRVGLQLGLFVFSATTLFFNPTARRSGCGPTPVGKGINAHAQGVAILPEGKHL